MDNFLEEDEEEERTEKMGEVDHYVSTYIVHTPEEEMKMREMSRKGRACGNTEAWHASFPTCPSLPS